MRYFIDEIDEEEYKREDFVSTRINQFRDFLSSVGGRNMNKRIFNGVKEIKETYGIDVVVPKDLPEGCNIICWAISSILSQGYFYRQSDGELFYYSEHGGDWKSTGSVSIEDVVEYDTHLGHKYIYLNLAIKDKSNVFTPERLLGVETTEGYINKLNHNIKGFVNIGYTTCHPADLKYYISNYNDQTVSLDEYVDMFYER